MKTIKIILFASFIYTSAFAFNLADQVRTYETRYQLNTRTQKLVDNQGDGYDALYGTRNLRTVLRGIMYRGGANNAYNKFQKRSNMNPLPDMGLKNLCQQGFGSAVYLYTTNFSTAPHSFSCQNLQSQNNNIIYKQMTALDEKNESAFIEMIYKAIKGQIPSPLYFHCWNGWHASGLVSTLALRQFCGLNTQEALNYWSQNTDGHSDGYDAIKKRIQNFKVYPQFQITDTESREICLTN